MPSEGKIDSLLVAQRGLEASNDEEGEPQNHTTELDEAVRAKKHAMSQLDRARPTSSSNFGGSNSPTPNYPKNHVKKKI
eukprot:SAG11_NODE_28356_length_322_cov_1.560538_1_plen_78_part_10